MRTISSIFITIAVGVSRLAAQNPGVIANMPGMNMPASDHPVGERAATLSGPMGSRGASGTASLTKSDLTITWSGDQPGSSRGWALHRGSCGHDQGMIGSVSSYPALSVDAHGSAAGAAHLEYPLSNGVSYFLALHAAATDSMSAIIACGGLAAHPITMSPTEMDSMPMGAMPTTRGVAVDSVPPQMMPIFMRLMADPVIRERVMTDPTLQRMLSRMGLDSAMSMKMPGMPGMSGMPEMPGMSMSPAASSPKSASRSHVTPKSSSAAKARHTDHPSAQKSSSTPKTTAKSSTTKPAAKKDSMPGMKMPPGTKMPAGMKMP